MQHEYEATAYFYFKWHFIFAEGRYIFYILIPRTSVDKYYKNLWKESACNLKTVMPVISKGVNRGPGISCLNRLGILYASMCNMLHTCYATEYVIIRVNLILLLRSSPASKDFCSLLALTQSYFTSEFKTLIGRPPTRSY